MSKLSEMAQRAYNFLSGRRWAYKNTFDNPNGQRVLKDLARFCRANDPTFHENERVDAALQGRREVWLRIQQHLQLSDEQLWELYGGDQG